MFPKNARSGASLALLVFLCCCGALRAGAAEKTELNLDLLVEQDYDSNVFALPKNPIGSAVTTVRPSIGLESISTLGTARLDGWLASHTFWSESGLNGVDRGVSAGGDRTIFPRINVFGYGSYQRVAPHSEIRGPDVVTITQPAPGVPVEPVIEPGQLIEGAQPNVDLGQAQIGGRYSLTPRSKLTLGGGPFSIDYLTGSLGSAEFRDSAGWTGSLDLDHTESALDRLHFTLGASSTDLDALVSGQLSSGKSKSDQQSFSIGWDRSWSELWVSQFSIGVRRLHSQTIGASRPITRVEPGAGGVQPVTDFVPTNFEDVGPGLIGGFTIQRVLPRGTAGFSYSRETHTTGSFSATDVNVDAVELSYLHRLSARATFTLAGGYQHYASVNNTEEIVGATYVTGSFNPITGPEFVCPQGSLIVTGSGANKGGQCALGAKSSLTSNAWNGSARLDWQLRKPLSTVVVLRFEGRMGDVELFGSNYNRFNVGVGFTYDYGLGL